MSAMSASSGLMPLSLISEHKAAQGGGPSPVQQLAFAPEKHSLAQAPKPTPNGMEPSPPLAPVLPPSQLEPQPSLPCGGVSETAGEEDRSGGVVPEVEPVEPAPPVVPVLADQPPATEPAVEPPSPAQVALPFVAPPAAAHSSGAPALSSGVSPVAPLISTSPASAVLPSTTQSAPLPSSGSEPVTGTPTVPSLLSSPSLVVPQASELQLSEPEPAEPVEEEVLQAASLPESSPAPVTLPEAVEAPQPAPSQPQDAQAPPKPSLPEPQVSAQPSNETEPSAKPKPELPVAPQPSPVVTPAPSAVGRPTKRAKAASSGAEKSTPVPVEKKSAPVSETSTADTENSEDKRAKRKRLPTQVYQSPIPEESIIAKISKIDKTPAVDDKLIVFYRNEFLAVRNAEGGFYVCQAMQNVYKSSAKIRIRWLSQLQNTDHYSPDFYDFTEFDCILTNLNMERIEKNKYRLPDVESQRTQSILKRAIDVENGVAPTDDTTVTEEHPDGLDLSLFRNEDQLKKRKKRAKNKKINKKTVKKVIAEGIKKSTREVPKRNKALEAKKPVPVPQSQPKRVVGRIAKVDKPVVQRIVAAKKMGRRKVGPGPGATGEVSLPPAASKEAGKKKEPPLRTVALKRKSAEAPLPTPPPEKKLKTGGASKTRSGGVGGPSEAQPSQQQRSRRSTRTK